MELTLNIYGKDRTIEKTYKANDYEIMHGTVEDLLDAVDLEAMTGADRTSMIAAVSRLLNARKDIIYPLIKDIFPGLTDEEIRRAKTSELVAVVISTVKYSLGEIRLLAFRR